MKKTLSVVIIPQHKQNIAKGDLCKRIRSSPVFYPEQEVGLLHISDKKFEINVHWQAQHVFLVKSVEEAGKICVDTYSNKLIESKQDSIGTNAYEGYVFEIIASYPQIINTMAISLETIEEIAKYKGECIFELKNYCEECKTYEVNPNCIFGKSCSKLNHIKDGHILGEVVPESKKETGTLEINSRPLRYVDRVESTDEDSPELVAAAMERYKSTYRTDDKELEEVLFERFPVNLVLPRTFPEGFDKNEGSRANWQNGVEWQKNRQEQMAIEFTEWKELHGYRCIEHPILKWVKGNGFQEFTTKQLFELWKARTK